MITTVFKLWYRVFPPKVPYVYHATLMQYSQYFRDLSEINKLRFLHRLYVLLQVTQFIPDRNLKVSLEMKVLIGSAIIQVTFGFKEFIYRRFNKIRIAPRPYTYRGYEHILFLGDVNFNSDVISMSWPNVVKGFKIPDDASNVALHEVAHCLEAERKFIGISSAFFKRSTLKNWYKEATHKLIAIQNNRHAFLRDYAGQNLRELFAVSVEAFFEQPEAFKAAIPNLYLVLSELLNQDPMRKEDPVLIPL